MKNNVVHFLAPALALVLFSLPLVAQTSSTGSTQTGSTATMGEGHGRHHGMPSVDERLQHLTKALSLSADQQAKIKPILQEQHDQMASLKQDTSMSKQDRRTKFEQIRQDTHQKMRDALNDDQKAKFDQMQARREQHMGKHHGGQSDTGTSSKQ